VNYSLRPLDKILRKLHPPIVSLIVLLFTGFINDLAWLLMATVAIYLILKVTQDPAWNVGPI
jgi:uncharacterized membrane protein YccF (DUF307 family)